jgi:hypothetical protein
VALDLPGTALAFRLADARPAPAVTSPEAVRYEGALGEGTELRLTPRHDGVEDRVAFQRRPPAEHVDYLVDVRSVAGLRKIGDVVEFLDEEGAPRLRMEAPYIEGADGRVAQAKVEVGCAHDEDPRGPWGRAVVKAGVEECRVRVDWEGADVTYPAVLDPVWTTTAAMAKDRVFCRVRAAGEWAFPGGGGGGRV